MSTKMGIWRWALASAALIVASGTASARLINDPPSVTTNDPAGIVIYPKIRVDVSNGVDTVVQMTNTSEFLTRVHCYYVNANGHCSTDDSIVCSAENASSVCPSGGRCIENWQETDFRLTLTKRQPISWSANDGLPALPLANTPGQGQPPQFNEGNIPPVPENPFTGELRCIQVDVSTELPSDRNDLKGEASVVTTVGDFIDTNKYNAVGIPAIEGAQDGDPTALNLGGPDAEYRGCPNILTLNHFFDGADIVTHGGTIEGPVRSRLTIVPCAADFLTQTVPTPGATIQFLIFNEFEQRFSTSTKVSCYKDVQLADIDTRPGSDGNEFSIFSAGVQGTLSGQSRLRSVAGPDVDGYGANGIIALLTENWAAGTCSGGAGSATGDWTPKAQELCASDADCDVGTCSDPAVSTDSTNVQYQGTRDQGDKIFISIP